MRTFSQVYLPTSSLVIDKDVQPGLPSYLILGQCGGEDVQPGLPTYLILGQCGGEDVQLGLPSCLNLGQ